MSLSAGELAAAGYSLQGSGGANPGDPFTPALAIAAGTGTSGYHTVDTAKLVDSITLVGAADDLTGGDGDDTLVGDNSLVVSAIVQGPFIKLETGIAYTDKQLIRVNSLIGNVVMQGAADRLSGGAGNDTLIGDHDVTVAGIFDGPALVIGAGQGVARSKTSKVDDELVDFVGLVDCIQTNGAFDVLQGEDGDDLLIGDSRATVTGVVLGPVIQGTDPADRLHSREALRDAGRVQRSGRVARHARRRRLAVRRRGRRRSHRRQQRHGCRRHARLRRSPDPRHSSVRSPTRIRSGNRSSTSTAWWIASRCPAAPTNCMARTATTF